jgi:integrase
MAMTDKSFSSKTKPGRYTDDNTKGLHLWIKPSDQKYWIFRYTFNGKRKGLSLGAYPEITLKMARQRAVEARNMINKGVCPSTAKTASKTVVKEVEAPIFETFALDYIETMRPKWKNPKHASQWVATIKTYAFPVIGHIQLHQIDTPQVLDILQPIWLTKSVTAKRLRGRLEKILGAALTRKHRTGQNPAAWRGHLENLLPIHKPSNKHHEALPYKELPQFIKSLRQADCLSALAMEFTILNASRTGEVLYAKRCEIEGDVWTIPASRMKAGQEHQVPLCQRSLDILKIAQSMDPDSDFLFSTKRKSLSGMAMLMLARRLRPGLTVHGFRSTFRDWVSEETDFSPEIAEMALAHTIGNRVERAYRRGNLLERRRRLMTDWASYCETGTWGNVMNIIEKKAA